MNCTDRIELDFDYEAMEMARISIKNEWHTPYEDRIIVTAEVFAKEDFQPEPGCRLELDLVLYHREYFIKKDQDEEEEIGEVRKILGVCHVFHRFYLEKNRSEAIEATIMNPKEYGDDLNVIMFKPRWEQRR